VKRYVKAIEILHPFGEGLRESSISYWDCRKESFDNSLYTATYCSSYDNKNLEVVRYIKFLS